MYFSLFLSFNLQYSHCFGEPESQYTADSVLSMLDYEIERKKTDLGARKRGVGESI
jgi:hypothetical protein